MNIACHHRHVCTVQKHTALRAQPHPFANLAQLPLFFSSLRDPPWSGTWTAWRACHEPAHLVLGEVLLRGSWTAQGPSVPGTLAGTGTSVVAMVSRVCSVPWLWFGTGASSLLPVCGGVGPMWWQWVTWCGCPAVPGDAVGVFPLVAPRLPWWHGDAVGLFLDPCVSAYPCACCVT